MLRSLVGSEMCIRDRIDTTNVREHGRYLIIGMKDRRLFPSRRLTVRYEGPKVLTAIDSLLCLLYTSDAADEEDSVDLGGRRIIKKKKNRENKGRDKKKIHKREI
eukprot:TRINITY_DN45379_c0_g1_i1.p2 TRINITY_DN45379_c0_g1~~TRINITY_DN45379_c0_g1_i1.p2  ORF type:complete len:105 (-),score=21.38 TRINITY_DN45379_c0_g1_i1:83-397(-)